MLERLRHGLVSLRGLAVIALIERLLHAFQAVAQLVQSGGDLGLRQRHHFAHALANVIGIALHVALEFHLLHLPQRFAELGGSLPLGGHEVAHGVLHALLEVFQVLGLAFLLPGQVFGLLARDAPALAVGTAHLGFEILLAARQFIGLPRQFVHFVAGLRAAHTLQHLPGFLQPLGGAPRFGLALRRAGLLRRRGVAHIL